MDLRAWMEQWNMLPNVGGMILCAVSGGRDSVCLLHYLHSIADECGFSLAAGHYNHHMRSTAQRDEDFVRQLCAELKIPFYADGADVCRVAEETGRGVEETGRALRYAYLEELADRIGAQRIATAHHMADQAETVLLNLVRGTGPEGLAGIPPVRGRLIRPLLNTPREEIELYLERNDLSCVEDETNENLRFSRNRLRRVVLPELEKINPALRRNIARTAAIVEREDRFLDSLAGEYLSAEGTEIPCDSLRSAPEALRPRIIRLMLDRLEAGRKDISAVHLEMVVQLGCRTSGGMVSLPGGIGVLCRNDRLKLYDTRILPGPMALATGTALWGGYELHISEVDGAAARKADALYLKKEVLSRELTVAGWKGSDGLALPELRGRRSVKRLLTERGIAPELRRYVPCIRVDGRAAAVYLLGTDREFAPEESDEVIEIIINEIE